MGLRQRRPTLSSAQIVPPSPKVQPSYQVKLYSKTPPVTQTRAYSKKLYKKICKVLGKVVLYELCGRDLFGGTRCEPRFNQVAK